MSSTTTTAVRVGLFPSPPPTNNTLDREERSRLLRSTRKLGAVLGTTPLVLESSRPTVRSASERVVRQERRIIHSPAPSISSEETLAISPEPEYVFVKSNTRTSSYEVQAVFDNASLSSSHSVSPPQGPVGARAPISRNLKRKQGQDPVLAPITIMFPLPGSSGSKHTHSASSSGSTSNKEKAKTVHPSQPLLLRFRPGPAQPNDRRIKPDTHSNSPPQPLSPASSIFNMNVDVTPPSPLLPSRDSGSNGLSDKEKRRKMAKLTRTLGENIPPELVFRAPTFTSPPSSNTPASSSSPVHVSRRTSLSISRPHNRPSMTSAFDPFHKPSKPSAAPKSAATASASVPPLAVAAAPTPAPSQPQPPSPSERPSTDKSGKRRHRPRSLTLGTSSAFAVASATLAQRERQPTRGTTSLEVQPSPSLVRPVPRVVSHQPQPSPRPFEVQDQMQEEQKVKMTHGTSLSIEFGRRKEREWSGEWNLKDMEDVAKKLRGLKGR